MIEKFRPLRDSTEAARAILLLIEAALGDQCELSSTSSNPLEGAHAFEFKGVDGVTFGIVVRFADRGAEDKKLLGEFYGPADQN